MPRRGGAALIRFAKLSPLTNCLARATLRHGAWQERECAKSRSLQAEERRPYRMLGCARGRTGIYERRTCELIQDSALPATWQDLRRDQTVGGITRLPHLSKSLRYSLHGILQRENYILRFNNFAFSCLVDSKSFVLNCTVVFRNQYYGNIVGK